jgi:hypothetical protein
VKTTSEILHENPSLGYWSVTLAEDAGDKFRLIFECFAMDADHAAEQALDAYPSGQVHHAWQVH